MTLRGEITKGYAAFQTLTFYEKLEQIAVLVLSGLIAIVIVAALWNLALRVVRGLVLEGSLDPTNYEVFQGVFGSIFTVIIALEFKRSILVAVERRETIFQVRTVVLLALLAILRKVIILDVTKTDALTLLALSAAILSLGGTYWLLRDQDARLEGGWPGEPYGGLSGHISLTRQEEDRDMANGQCDICGKPATVRAQVVSNGERRQMELCDEHYRQIARQSRGRSASPLESLFGRSGSLFEDFFGDSLFSDQEVPEPRRRRGWTRARAPRRPARRHGAWRSG